MGLGGDQVNWADYTAENTATKSEEVVAEATETVEATEDKKEG